MSSVSPSSRPEFEPFFDLAHVTGDGVVVGVSEKVQRHPVYGTDAYEMALHLPLFEHEAEQYSELVRHGIGHVRGHVRSALAQMGNTAFHPDSFEHVLHGDMLHISTLVTNLNGEAGQRSIDVMRDLAREKHEPRFMHAGLLPDHARLSSREEIQDAQQRGGIIVASDADLYVDGSIGLPHNTVYEFHDAAFTREQIAKILLNEGRANLESNRRSAHGFPETFTKGQFLVTGAELRSVDYHVVLRPSLVVGTEKISAFQLESPVLHAGRTNRGLRQFEVYAPEDYAVSLADTRVVADFYKASVISEAGH